MTTLRIATRRSKLALWQANWVKATLESASPGCSVELIEIVTSGDRIQDRTLREIGGKALFVKEIEAALLEDTADIAVHSLKDLPTDLPGGLELLAVPKREDPRDALVTQSGATIDELANGAHVGTASLRRQTLLLRMRPDLKITPLRGNVDTRLRKLAEDDYDAIVLAEAGLSRLGFDTVKRDRLDVERFVPAACQGLLGIEAPPNRPDLEWVKETLNHPPARLQAEVERAFLVLVEGSCKVPVGAFARWEDSALVATGMVGDESGKIIQRTVKTELTTTGPEALQTAAELGKKLAHAVLDAGGAAIVASFSEEAGDVKVNG